MPDHVSLFHIPPNLKKPLLCVITGPTAVGKTDLTLDLAQRHGAPVISADSRQFYKEMSIGTAKPSLSELRQIPHYFLGHLSVKDYYSVSRFEQDVLKILPDLFSQSPMVILSGGSGLYIDAVCYGIDDLPDPDPEIRLHVMTIYETGGIEELRRQIKMMDPVFYQNADMANPKRLIRALEVCLQTGNPYSAYLKSETKERQFDILKFCLLRPREELFGRINARVDSMMEKGLLNEVKALEPFRKYNALNTVGYKELFDYLDGNISLDMAVEQIKTHTRRYAKRQMTWFKRKNDYIEVVL